MNKVIVNYETMEIDCPSHGKQRLVIAEEDGCMDCEACLAQEQRDSEVQEE